MSIFSITIITFWVAPILGFGAFFLLKKIPKLKRLLFISFGIVLTLMVLSILTEITFTSNILDFLFFSVFYLAIWFVIWNLKSINNLIFQRTGTIIIIIGLILNYFTCSIGILGVGFALTKFDPTKEIEIGKDYIYKEYGLGMATDDYRGKRVKIYKKKSAFPLEWPIRELNHIAKHSEYTFNLKFKYNEEKNEVYLYGTDRSTNREFRQWKDTITLNE